MTDSSPWKLNEVELAVLRVRVSLSTSPNLSPAALEKASNGETLTVVAGLSDTVGMGVRQEAWLWMTGRITTS